MQFKDNTPTQDDIYRLLLQYMVIKGVISDEQAKKGWNHDVEKTYKDFAYAIGVNPPVQVPTTEETMPLQIVDDEDWLNMLGIDVAQDREKAQQVQQTRTPQESDSAPADGAGSVQESENGDLNFVLQTGLNQPKLPTEVESLANTVIANTEKMAGEIESGEMVTKESIDADKADDIDAEQDAPPPAADAPATGGDQKAGDDLDHIDA